MARSFLVIQLRVLFARSIQYSGNDYISYTINLFPLVLLIFKVTFA